MKQQNSKYFARSSFGGNRRTKTIMGNREQKTLNFRWGGGWGGRGTRPFISGEHGDIYPPHFGRASRMYRLPYTSKHNKVMLHIKLIGLMKYSSMVANILPTDPYPLDLWLKRPKFNFFRTCSVMLDIKFIGITKCCNKVATILPAAHVPRGQKVKVQLFSEQCHVVYQIKGNQECSNMVANVLPADTPHARTHARTYARTHTHTHACTHADTHTHTHNHGHGANRSKFNFLEHGHVAYQIYWNHKM